MPIMMFQSVLRPRSNWGWDHEPDELRQLKFQLANLKCRCNTCQRIKPPQGIQDFALIKNHRGIQAKLKNNCSDRFIQVTPGSVLSEVYVSQGATFKANTEKGCPKCTAAMHPLHTEVTRIVKDEESETIAMDTCDKSNGSQVKLKENCTSTVAFVSGARKDLTSSEASVVSPPSPKLNHTRVTFSDIRQEEDLIQRPLDLAKPKCTCLEKFIESIRPPIIGY